MTADQAPNRARLLRQLRLRQWPDVKARQPQSAHALNVSVPPHLVMGGRGQPQGVAGLRLEAYARRQPVAVRRRQATRHRLHGCSAISAPSAPRARYAAIPNWSRTTSPPLVLLGGVARNDLTTNVFQGLDLPVEQVNDWDGEQGAYFSYGGTRSHPELTGGQPAILTKARVVNGRGITPDWRLDE